MNAVDKKLISMLKENTGIHMMDSGGQGNRNWQRNQLIDFGKQEPFSLNFSILRPFDNVMKRRLSYGDGELSIEISRDVFHYLRERLEITERSRSLNRNFKNFNRRKDQQDEGWLVVAENWLQEYYPENSHRERNWVNTYNGECLLSQTLQFLEFEEGIILQIHGGADVRGGYTVPYIFECEGLYDFNDVMIEGGPKGPAPGQLDLHGQMTKHQERHHWTTDDGYHFYYEGCAGLNAGLELQKYTATDDEEQRGKGVVYVDENGNGYCPFTGEKLTIR